MKKEYKFLIALLILFTIYNLFFINKAVHIDCHATIIMAKVIEENFLKPSPMFLSNPILLGYYYAPVLNLFGEREIAFHIFHLPFSLLVIISMFFLSLRFSNRSIFPVLFLVSTPAFIVISHNIMQDIPLLAFFLASIASFIYGTDKDDKKLLVLSGILAGVAILIKYSGLLLIPLLAIYSLIFSKKRNCLYLIIPIFIFLLWSFHNTILYHQWIFFEALLMKLRQFFSIRDILIRTLACIIFLSGTSIISIFLIPFLLRKKSNINLFLFSGVIGLCLFLIKKPFLEYSVLEKSVLGLLFVGSLFIILLIFKMGYLSFIQRIQNKDILFLSFWFSLMLIFTILLQFIAARFVLLLFPPMFLLIYSQLKSDKKVISIFIIVTVFLSTIVAVGDYYYAGIYRDIVSYVKESMIAQQDQIHFLSASWGYYYYIKKGGYDHLAIYIERDGGGMEKKLQYDNIFIVVPDEHSLPYHVFKNICLEELSKLNYNKVLVERLNYYGNVILHNRKFHAGFYSHDWGLLPFYLSMRKVPLEGFEIYRLSYSPR